MALQLNDLQNCLNPNAVTKQLASLPTDLDGTYERILRNILPINQEDTKIFLYWLAFSERPMSVEEIAAVAVVDLNSDNGPWCDPNRQYFDPEDVLTACSSLVTKSYGTIEIQTVLF